MTKQLQHIVDRLLVAAGFGIRYAACAEGGDPARLLRDLMEEAEYRFMRARKGAGVRPVTLSRWEAELREASAVLEREVRERFARHRRSRDIALIEYPLLSVRIGDGLRRRGVPFLFETRLDENILTVRVVDEYFLEIPVTLESVDRTVGLVPYCIHRPDLAHEEIPGIRRIRDYGLARSWNASVSSVSGASDGTPFNVASNQHYL